MAKIEAKRIGLRVHEIEASLAANINPLSAELVEYVWTREVGRAARLAMLIRGMDVIKDKQYLARIAVSELKIEPNSFENVIRTLMDAGLLRDGTILGKDVWVENVAQVDFSSNYERLGDLWLSKNPLEKEKATVYLLDTLIESPRYLDDIPEFANLSPYERKRVIEVAVNACFIDDIQIEPNAPSLYFTPLLWDVDPNKLQKYLVTHSSKDLATIVSSISSRQGYDITDKINIKDPMFIDAIRSGVLPSHTISSMGGVRTYSFAPYTGKILTSPEEREILRRSRAIVACMRYGSEAAAITKIFSPRAILNALTDGNRNYRIGPHSEIKDQYGILVTKGVGKIIKTGGHRYYFQLIASNENKQAVGIAMDFLSKGGTPPESAINLPDGARVLSLSGEMTTTEEEIRIARQQKKATSDELADLVESLQTTS